MGDQSGSVADADPLADGAIGPDLDVLAEFGAGSDYRGRVDSHLECSSDGEAPDECNVYTSDAGRATFRRTPAVRIGRCQRALRPCRRRFRQAGG